MSGKEHIEKAPPDTARKARNDLYLFASRLLLAIDRFMQRHQMITTPLAILRQFVGAVLVANSMAISLAIPVHAANLPSEKAVSLPSFQVDLGKTSVSGISSGAFMATQFHIAFSKTVVGAGIVAGGPYYCAGASPTASFLHNATSICHAPPPGFEPDAKFLFEQAQGFAKKGEIDPLDNLKTSKIYLFTGMADTIVTSKVVEQAQRFFQLAGVPPKNIHYIDRVNAGHAMITNNPKDSACPVTASPYLNDCHFVQSQDILRHIYDDLKAPALELSGHIIKFSQAQFISSNFSSMSDYGYAYVPKSCESASCKVHIVFHGCEQGAGKIGDLFYRTTGYNEIADTNNMIVLYPQVDSSSGLWPPYNPLGCWDYWGYSRLFFLPANFYTRKATQMVAVKGMLDRLAQPRK